MQRTVNVFFMIAAVWLGFGILGIAASDIVHRCPDLAPWPASYIAGRLASGPLSVVAAYQKDECDDGHQ